MHGHPCKSPAPAKELSQEEAADFLHTAVLKCDIAAVTALCARGVDINEQQTVQLNHGWNTDNFRLTALFKLINAMLGNAEQPDGRSKVKLSTKEYQRLHSRGNKVAQIGQSNLTQRLGDGDGPSSQDLHGF